MSRASTLVCLCLALASGCGPRRVSAPAVEGPALVVLLADPDTGAVGRATVSNANGVVELTADRDATTVLTGRAPAPVGPLAADTLARVFGETLSTLPMAPMSFTLYFRLESNELTDESRALLPGVLKAVATHPAPDVAVVGHTDTSGVPATNYALGLERAATVRTLLAGVGVEASLIEVSSHGESDPVVPTPDNTLEPRNRRVEISVR
jgi:outer membrane protein OmpA-like peptidoglycan-associated protein